MIGGSLWEGVDFAGRPIDSIRVSAYRLSTSEFNQASWRVVVAGEMASGVISEKWVPGADSVSVYVAGKNEVTGRTFEQRGTESYAFGAVKP